MNKNRTSSSPGSATGSLRGDVSFIRATQSAGPPATSTSNQNLDKLSPQHSNQNVTHLPRMPLDVSLQPHLCHSHHHQSRQQHLPEHLEPQHHLPKQSHGAGGASGEPAAVVARVPSHVDVEGWSEREESLAAELEEAKVRVAQMEKTMRWWSDCTSNWREKWNKARNERNKAREENRLLRSKLETATKELARLKREHKEPTSEKAAAPHEENHLPQGSGANKSQETFQLSEKQKMPSTGTSEKEHENLDDVSEASSMSRATSSHHDEKDGEGSVSGESTVLSEMSDRIVCLQEKEAQLKEELAQAQNKTAQIQETLVLMQRKLDEANNTIQLERLENCNKMKVIERLERELNFAQCKLDEGSVSMQELRVEVERNKRQQQEQIDRLTVDLEDEALSRTSMDKRVSELRRELEQIQAENASEWAKRERLESEKLALERENKKLRTQVRDLEEEVDKKNQVTSSMADSDIKSLQFELTERNKELADVQHVHGKLKKALAERTTELDHHRRRAEQYETEVRSLRGRVDKLKHDLAAAEDEVDKQQNAARKAQRTSDELQAQVESLELQVGHLQTRLRRNSKHGSITTPRSTSLKSLTMEDSAELADSETDFDDV